jgi:hypothetical protein
MKITKLYVGVACVIAGLLIAGCNQPTAEKSKPPEAKPAAKAAEAAKPVAAPKAAEILKPTVASKPAEAPKPAPAAASSGKFAMRVNCGATDPYTDKAGKVWVADQEWSEGKAWGAQGGSTVDRGSLQIAGTDCPHVYELERYDVTIYKFTVPNGKYTVRLHFAETYDGISNAGERVFSVSIADKQVLKDLDVFKEAGGLNKPVVKEFKDISVDNGQLTIGFTANVQSTEVNGIEILAQ